MIESLFSSLSQALSSTPIIALLAAFAWGILSILLSPCHLSSIPLIVGFINGQGKVTTKRAFQLSLLFSIGILTTIILLGVITSLLGRMLGDVGRFRNYFAAVIFFLVGLYLLDVISLNFFQAPDPSKVKKRGLLAAFILGLVFGIALGPCTFAYMAPILAITLSTAGTQLLLGILLLVFYGVGHCSVIVLAGTFTEILQRYLNWSAESRGARWLKKVCGILVILAGIYLMLNN
ncbi:MAG: cytochrome c biogenesis protein CcdA [Candidatus Marinimicrobia bacterium]|nr:cytochrome c biogenesis protein CcdA [Candidatus Neomarinimicrobiota bacterium]